jgi:hypothetical protein
VCSSDLAQPIMRVAPAAGTVSLSALVSPKRDEDDGEDEETVKAPVTQAEIVPTPASVRTAVPPEEGIQPTAEIANGNVPAVGESVEPTVKTPPAEEPVRGISLKPGQVVKF